MLQVLHSGMRAAQLSRFVASSAGAVEVLLQKQTQSLRQT